MRILRTIYHIALSSGLLLNITSCSTSSQTEMKLEIQNNTNAYLIPIKIKGKEYKFLFDTGASQSLISDRLSKDLDLNRTSYVIETEEQLLSRINDTISYDNVEYQLGGLKASTQFIIDGYNGVYARDRNNTNLNTELDGLIGTDIISQYNWLFDFERKTVTVSDVSKDVDIAPCVEDLVVSFRSQQDYIYLRMMGTTQNFTFDTGYIHHLSFQDKIVKLGDVNVHPDFIFTDSVFNLVTSPNKTMYPSKSFITRTDDGIEIKALLMDTLELNKMPVNSLIALIPSTRIDICTMNIVTNYFPMQFRMMYINQKDGEIRFYKYEQKDESDRISNIRKQLYL